MVLVSFNSLNASKYKSLIETLKRKNNKILAGGPHPSARPWQVYQWGADWVVVGEGEEVCVEIAKGKIPSGVIRAAPVNLSKFFPFPRHTELLSPIELTRGCIGGCRFCQVPYLFGKKYRHRSIEQVKEAISFAYKKGVRDFRFISPNAFSYLSENFNPNLEALYEIFVYVKKLKETRLFLGSFPSEVRPESVNAEVIKLLKNFVSNKKIVVGVQTASERLQKYIGRFTPLEKIYSALDEIKRGGFQPIVDMIYGFPTETFEDREKNRIFIEKITKEFGAKIHLHYFMPLPGTPMEKEKPTPLDRETMKFLGKLTREGKADGSWVRQMAFQTL